MAGLGAAAAIVAQTAPKGCGTVFQLTPQVDGRWNEAILRSFVSTMVDRGVLSSKMHPATSTVLQRVDRLVTARSSN
jgi:hypothetical protein